MLTRGDADNVGMRSLTLFCLVCFALLGCGESQQVEEVTDIEEVEGRLDDCLGGDLRRLTQALYALREEPESTHTANARLLAKDDLPLSCAGADKVGAKADCLAKKAATLANAINAATWLGDADAENKRLALKHGATALSNLIAEYNKAFTTFPVAGTATKVTNWFDWKLDIPRPLARAAFLLRVNGHWNPSWVKLAHERGVGLQPPAPQFEAGQHWNGGNLIAALEIHLNFAMARRSTPATCEVIRRINQAYAIRPYLAGIQPDGSLRFHGEQSSAARPVGQVTIGGYGSEFALRSAIFLRLLGRHLAPEAKWNAAGFILGAARWSSWEGYTDPSVSGRQAMSDPSGGGFGHVGAMALLGTLNDDEALSRIADEAREAFASSTDQWPTLRAGVAPLFRRVGKPAVPGVVSRVAPDSTTWRAGEALGVKAFPWVDYVVARRSDSFTSVRLLSSRMMPADVQEGFNYRAVRQADGHLFVSMDGTEYRRDGAIATMDWALQPGITVLDVPHAEEVGWGDPRVKQNRPNNRSFVGGLSEGSTPHRNYAAGTGPFAGVRDEHGDVGLAAMEYASPTPRRKLEFHKSFFFFGDSTGAITNEVRCIDCVDGARLTVITQWPLHASQRGPITVMHSNGHQSAYPRHSAAPLKADVNPAWATADGLGWVFPVSPSAGVPAAPDVKLTVQEQTGCYDSFTRDGGCHGPVSDEFVAKDQLIRKDWVTMTFRHTSPASTVAWLTVPHADPALLARWEAPRLVAAKSAVHAWADERDAKRTHLGLVTWESATVPWEGTLNSVRLEGKDAAWVTIDTQTAATLIQVTTRDLEMKGRPAQITFGADVSLTRQRGCTVTRVGRVQTFVFARQGAATCFAEFQPVSQRSNDARLPVEPEGTDEPPPEVADFVEDEE